MNIYCISGLGADERVFRNMDFHPHRVIHLKWISPVKNEPLRSYALRMGQSIDQSKPFVLMGLSFGGMLAQELAKTMHPYRTIVISSIAGKHEQPFRTRIMDRLNIYDLVPDKYFCRPSKIAFYLFSAKTEEERQILAEILSESDPDYTRWALNAIAKWDNQEIVPAFRINGSDDKLFPIRKITHDYTVKGGGHLMVIRFAKEIQQEILKAIGSVH